MCHTGQCAELHKDFMDLVVDEKQYLVKVPQTVVFAGVLAEAMSGAEKQ